MIPTFIVALKPQLRIDTDAISKIDFETWRTDIYDWEKDELNGFLDLTAPVSKTIESGHGDCEDFAMVAASWACANGFETSIAVVGHHFHGVPIPTHFITHADGHVYSSGRKIPGTLDEYVEQSDEYEWLYQYTITCPE